MSFCFRNRFHGHFSASTTPLTTITSNSKREPASMNLSFISHALFLFLLTSASS